MLFRNPHIGFHYRAEDCVAPSLRVGGTVYGDKYGLVGQLTPMTAQAALEKTGVEIDRPHLWLWSRDRDISVGDLLVIQGRYFVAARPQEVWDAEPVTAHRSVVLTELIGEAVELANEDL